MKSRNYLIIAFLFCSVILTAQRPKLDLKAYAGYHTHVFVYKEIQKSKDVLHGWQAGFGFRVSYRKVFSEVDFNFVRSRIIVPIEDSLMVDFDKVEVKINSFELPIKVGFIPIKTGFFKWYVYTGLAVRINTKGKFIVGDNEETFKPKELGLTNPNLDFLLGTQMDIGSFNLELMYSLGINSSLTENIRTNSHEIQFNVGIWF